MRRGDAIAADVARAVATAHHDLTGMRGLYWEAMHERYQGSLLDLAREIEAHFACTGLLSTARLKNIPRPKNFPTKTP